ncbi:hypothetical protein HXX76_002479 [Chlamydomonas incerta]|uniref:Uncharacterized protein n=1 Tax=Chlamydomonas incerta TaxID=51695 RepID=A0A835W909_CHLIN|nr:hypothetical protein HXX76_002479 [Chlamydomonas incerta]|eukprot:KAG2442393.1 hypothetical protein HXX76_002479 [Chlamydomonas incerta]
MQRSSFHTLDRGGKSLLHSSTSAAGDQADASAPTDRSGGGLAGALARRQRSALVALACGPDDLPPTAAPSGLHLQAQQRARCALGRHERACASGYRPHLRAAATARAVLAVAGGLAPDAAAAAAEQAAAREVQTQDQLWERLLKAAQQYERAVGQYTTKDIKDNRDVRELGGAIMAVMAAVEEVSMSNMPTVLALSPAESLAELESRQQITACGRVLYRPLEGVCTPSWLQWTEFNELLPARAVLLLHCHTVLASPVMDYEQLAAAGAISNLQRRHMKLLDGTPGVRLLLAGRTRGGHMAAAVALTDGLWRYWGCAGANGGGAAAAAGGAAGGQVDGAPPVLCPEMTVLANVVSFSQALVLRLTPEAEAGAGATGVLAALTRPAVLLRVWHVLTAELLFRTPALMAMPLIRTVLSHYFSRNLTDAVGELRSSRKDAAAVAAAAAAAVGTEGAAQQQQLLMGRLRALYLVEQDTTRQSVQREHAAAAADAKRLLGRSDTSQAVAASPSGRAAAELADLRAEQYRLVRMEAMARAGERLADAVFNAPWAPAAEADGAAAAAAASRASGASAAGGGNTGVQRAGGSGAGGAAAAAAAAAAAGDGAAARSPAPAPPSTPVLMMPQRARAEVEWRGSGQDARRDTASQAQMRALFRWAAQESTNREALARAMLGALAPCWEAMALGCSGRPAQSAAAASPSPSHCSLVLQGAPAICYSLARTAAVNYVLDRVARGLAAVEVATAEAAEATAAGATGPADPAADGAEAAISAAGAEAEVAVDAVAVDAGPPVPGGASDPLFDQALDLARRWAQLLPQYQWACGWPLMVTLSSSAEERAEHARRMPAELLKQLPPLSTKPDIPELLRQRSCLVATWTAPQASPQPPDPQPEQQAGEESAVEGASGGEAAGIASSPAGGGSTFQEAVSQRILAAPPVCVPAGSDDTMAEYAVRQVDSELQLQPLRAARLQPADAEQTAAVAVALAELSHRLRSSGAPPAPPPPLPPRELVVVPLLDELIVQRDMDLLGIRMHLDGVAWLVLRDLSMPLVLHQSEDKEGEGEQDGAAAAGERGQPEGSTQPEAAAAAAEPAAEDERLAITCRGLRPDWQCRLPLALNRAACRLAGVPLATMGWTLADLSRLQEPRHLGDDRADEKLAAEKQEQGETRAVGAASAYARQISCLAKIKKLQGSAEASAEHAAAAVVVQQLCDSFVDIVRASESDVEELGDAEEGGRQPELESLTRRDLFADLVPAARDEWAPELSGLGVRWRRSGLQAVQLLVAEAAPGRPTELLAAGLAVDAAPFYTLDLGGKSLLHSSTSAAGDQANASAPTDLPGRDPSLAGALARRQRSALVALAGGPGDLPPTAAPSRLHLQAQQRARCALGRHERACDSGYRPHLRAAATARAVLAVAGGLAPDAAAEHWERVDLQRLQDEQMTSSAAEADARRQQTAFGGVQVEPPDGVVVPWWLQLEDPVLAPRAALLLHCHVELARPVHEGLHDLLAQTQAAAAAAAEGLPFGQQADGGAHLAVAATLADALWSYWHVQAAAGGAAAGGEGGGDAARTDGWQRPAPLLATDMTVLACVVSYAQVLVLRKCGEAPHGRATGALAALTRPAVLLRVARVLSQEVLLKVPPIDGLQTLLNTLRRDFVQSVAGAMGDIVLSAAMGAEAGASAAAAGVRGDASATVASVASAAAAIAGAGPAATAKGPAAAAAGGGASVEQQLRLLRVAFERRQESIRESASRRRAEVGAAADAAAGKSASAASPGRGLKGAAAEAPAGKQQQQQERQQQQMADNHRKVLRNEVAIQAWKTLTSVLFEPPPAAVPAAAAAAAQPPPVLQPLLMLPEREKVQVDKWAVGFGSGGKGEDAVGFNLHRAAFRWAAAESANRAALARALVSAMTPCWTFSSPPPADSSPLPYSYSPHSSLVLQGAPAICYSLARTAAVNYVLDQVARGLAAAWAMGEAAAEAAAEAADASAPPLPVDAAELAAAASGVDGGMPARVAKCDDAAAALYIAAADKLVQILPEFHYNCGWPLVVTLADGGGGGGGGEAAARAAGHGGGPAQLLEAVYKQVSVQDAGFDAVAFLKACPCVVATWATAEAPAADAAQQQGQQQPPEAEEQPAAAGGDPAPGPAADGGATGQKYKLPAAVAARALAAAAVGIPRDCSPATAARAALAAMEAALARSPLRAVAIKPVDEDQTAAFVVALAQSLQQTRAGAEASQHRELAVVPLLDPGVLRTHAPGAAFALKCAAAHAVRDLTAQPMTPEQGDQWEAASQEPQADGGGQAEAAAAVAAGALEAGAKEAGRQEDRGLGLSPFPKARKLQINVADRLHVALNRAVCRAASVSPHTIGWTLADLPPRGVAFECSEEQHEEQHEEQQRRLAASADSSSSSGGSSSSAGVFADLPGFPVVCGASALCQAARQRAARLRAARAPAAEVAAAGARERALDQLCCALRYLLEADGAEADYCAGGEGGDDEEERKVCEPDVLQRLVRAAGDDHDALRGLGMHVWGRPTSEARQQPLHLLVAEAQPGRPTEMVAGAPAYQAMDELD